MKRNEALAVAAALAGCALCAELSAGSATSTPVATVTDSASVRIVAPRDGTRFTVDDFLASSARANPLLRSGTPPAEPDGARLVGRYVSVSSEPDLVFAVSRPAPNIVNIEYN
jgi:hypothetical protein